MAYPFRAIVFDFDGLIVDTERPIYEAYRAVFAEYGVPLTVEMWSGVIGASSERGLLFERLDSAIGGRVDREEVRRRARGHRLNATDALPAQAGVAEHIAQAKEAGLKLGVASSSSAEWVRRHLGRLGLLASFDAVCTRDDVQRTKPAPDLYELALERLGAGAHEAFAIEDSPHGVTAAKAAGLRCVAVPNSLTAQMPLDHADLRLGSLADVSLAELAATLGR